MQDEQFLVIFKVYALQNKNTYLHTLEQWKQCVQMSFLSAGYSISKLVHKISALR